VQSTPIEDLSQRGAAYGIRSRRVDGMDPEAVHEAVREAAEIAREGGGPSFIEALTYRHLGHSKSDKRVYRTREEEALWLERDPVRRWQERLRAAGLPQADLDRLAAEVEGEITRAVAFAEESPEPEGRLASRGVYA